MHIIIPARYDSVRLPGKSLCDVAGKPLIQRVYECAQQARAERITIATDDSRIQKVAEEFGAEVCMTSDQHHSGTDRIAEVVSTLGLADNDIIVNLQGDEPLVPPALIQQVVKILETHSDAVMSTCCYQIDNERDRHDPNVVKVVTDRQGYALYFSRVAIPWRQKQGAEHLSAKCHIGLYAYRAGFIKIFSSWAPCPPEQTEHLEQLRVLWRGEKIVVSEASDPPGHGVDTEEDLQRIRQHFQ